MKPLFVKLVTGQAPRIKVAITGCIAWLLSLLITRFALSVTPAEASQLSLIIGTAIWGALESAAAKLADTGIKKIQDVLPPEVLTDGHVGDVTVAAVKMATNQAAGTVVNPLTRDERDALKDAQSDVVSGQKP